MLDTFYPWLVSFLTIALGLVISLWAKLFERRGYRIAAGICGVILGIATFVEMEHERRKSTRDRGEEKYKAAIDREAAIQETSVRVSADLTKQYANTVSTQAQKIGELEGFIQSQGKDIRDVMKYTATNAARLNTLWEQNQTGKQKRQEAKDHLHGYLGMNNSVLGPCGNVSPPGRGGSSPQACINDAKAWVSGAEGYISGSLGELYLHRFELAGLRHSGEPPATGIDSNLDPYTRAEVSWAMYELEAKANVIKEFIKELDQ